MRSLARSLLIPLIATGFLWTTAKASAQTRFFDLTLTNLTSAAPGSGQPFSAPVFFTHDSSAIPWTMGDIASFPLQQIAEEGDNSALLADLSTQIGGSVGEVRTPLSGPLMPGQSVTLTIAADMSRPLLSTVWMLGRTNDGFSGLSGLNLFSPSAPGVYDLIALDAGTEVNNELSAFLPAFSGFLNDPERGVIAPHAGILGGADIPLSWSFSNPVARLTIAASAAPEPAPLLLLVPVIATLALRRRARRG